MRVLIFAIVGIVIILWLLNMWVEWMLRGGEDMAVIDAAYLAAVVADTLQMRDDIAEAEVVEPSGVALTTQGGVKFDVIIYDHGVTPAINRE